MPRSATSVTKAKADAIGRLATLPLCEVLTSLLELKSSGTLVLQERSGRKCALYFHQGAVVKAQTPTQVSACADSGEGLARHVEWVAGLPGSTVYGFYTDTDYLPGCRPCPSRPLALLWCCARHSVDVARVERVIASLDDQHLVLHPFAKLDRFGLSPDEAALVGPLRRKPRHLCELIERYTGDPAVACKLIYTLAISHHLDLGDGAQPIGIQGSGIVELPVSGEVMAERRRKTPVGVPRAQGSSPGAKRKMSGLANSLRASGSSRAKRDSSNRARGRAVR
jgi:hypothetical protein